MRTDKIRKYILPNLPYLLVGWAMLKIGTAYRMAAGADLGAKLLGTLQTIGPAFADLAPGFNPLDWLAAALSCWEQPLFLCCPACSKGIAYGLSHRLAQ